MAYEQAPQLRRKKVVAGDVVTVKIGVGERAADQRKQVALYERAGYERTGEAKDGGVELSIRAETLAAHKRNARMVAKERIVKVVSAGVPGQTEDFVSLGKRRYNAGGVVDRDTLKTLIREEISARKSAGEDVPDPGSET